MPLSPKMTYSPLLVRGSVVLFALLLPPAARADIFTFQIDSTQSVLTLSGLVNGSAPSVEQAPGSLINTLSGTFALDVNLETGEFSFAPGFAIPVPDHPGDFRPFTGPAAFAGKVDIAPGTTGYGAYRHLSVELTSGVLTVDENLRFPASQLTVALHGNVDLEVPGVLPPTSYFLDWLQVQNLSSGASIGSGLPTIVPNNIILPNGSTEFGRIELNEDSIKLTLPIDITFSFIRPGLSLTNHFQGTLVGVVVPEAGSMALVGLTGLGGAAVALLRRRRGASSVN